jgi:hypothetical protein
MKTNPDSKDQPLSEENSKRGTAHEVNKSPVSSWGEQIRNLAELVETPISYAGLIAVLAFVLIVVGPLTPNTDSNFRMAVLGVAIAMLAVASLFVWKCRPKPVVDRNVFTAFEHLPNRPLSLFIEDSPLPMFLTERTTEKKLIVRYCNKALVEFLHVDPSEITNKRIEVLVAMFRDRMPIEKRGQFDKRQKERLEMGRGRAAPPDDLFETVIDTSALNAPNSGLFTVWVRTFSVRSDQKSMIGAISIWMPIRRP